MIRDEESDRGVGTDHRDWSLSQPRHEFLNVSNPENLSEGRPEGGVVPEMEIETARKVSAGREAAFVALTSSQILPTLQQ